VVFSEGAITFLLGSGSGTKPTTQALNSPIESPTPEPSSFISAQALMSPLTLALSPRIGGEGKGEGEHV